MTAECTIEPVERWIGLTAYCNRRGIWPFETETTSKLIGMWERGIRMSMPAVHPS